MWKALLYKHPVLRPFSKNISAITGTYDFEFLCDTKNVICARNVFRKWPKAGEMVSNLAVAKGKEYKIKVKHTNSLSYLPVMPEIKPRKRHTNSLSILTVMPEIVVSISRSTQNSRTPLVLNSEFTHSFGVKRQMSCWMYASHLQSRFVPNQS